MALIILADGRVSLMNHESFFVVNVDHEHSSNLLLCWTGGPNFTHSLSPTFDIDGPCHSPSSSWFSICRVVVAWKLWGTRRRICSPRPSGDGLNNWNAPGIKTPFPFCQFAVACPPTPTTTHSGQSPRPLTVASLCRENLWWFKVYSLSSCFCTHPSEWSCENGRRKN